jgi:hypothetical protein
VNFVFIDAGADGAIDEDVFRGILALSSIVSFRIHLTITPQNPHLELSPLLMKTDLRALLYNGVTPYGTAIVIPRMTDEAQIPKSDEARRVRDEKLTKEFQKECRQPTCAVMSAMVFGQPDPAHSKDIYLASVKDLANLTVSRARGELMPLSVVVKVFENATRVVQGMGENVKPNIAVHSIFSRMAIERLEEILTPIIRKYTKILLVILLKDKMAFEIGPEIRKIEKLIIDELNKKLNALPPQLRGMIHPDRINSEVQNIKESLQETLQERLWFPQETLKDDFAMSCSSNRETMVTNTKERYSDWVFWFSKPKIVAAAKLDFTEAVGFEKLPLKMREAVMVIYNNYLQSIAIALDGYTQKKNNWLFYWPAWIGISVFLIINVCIWVPKSFRFVKGLIDDCKSVGLFQTKEEKENQKQPQAKAEAEVEAEAPDN